jgi:hypothetical protein
MKNEKRKKKREENMKHVIFIVAILFIASNLIAFTGWWEGTHSGTTGLEFRRIVSTQNVEVRKGPRTADVVNMVIPSIVTIQGVQYSVTEIADSGFSVGMFWTSITTNVLIPNSVTSIGRFAFSGSYALINIVIPSSVTSIGEGAFRGCDGLETMTVESGNTVFRSAGNCVIRRSNNELIIGIKTSIIPYGVTRIGDAAFMNNIELISITIPSSVTSIGHGAFQSCIGLTSIFIPNSVTSIENWAFLNCPNLTIYTEHSLLPWGWATYWNPNWRPVVWGYTVSDFDIIETVYETRLVSNFPNPFNPETVIAFSLSNVGNVEINVYNVRGQLVRTLVNDVYNAGVHQVVWNGRDENGVQVGSGVYFYRMRAGEYHSMRRMILMK